MQLHELKSSHKKKAKRIGRGGKRGTYSGRGMKGQKSRAGRKLAPIIRETIKRYPKLRGYRFKSINLLARIVSLETLEKKFNTKKTSSSAPQLINKVTPIILTKMGLVRKMKGKVSRVKILGKGEITKKLIIEGCEVSKIAKEKIEKVGGKII